MANVSTYIRTCTERGSVRPPKSGQIRRKATATARQRSVRRACRLAGLIALAALAASCTPGAATPTPTSAGPSRSSVDRGPVSTTVPKPSATLPPEINAVDANPLPGMPPIADPYNIYAADQPGNFTASARAARPLVYVPDTLSNDVYVIDPATKKVIDRFPVGDGPQHVVPSYDGSVLWVTNDRSNSLTPINPRSGKPGTPVPVEDPYNLYFTPDGRYAVVVAEARMRLDFRSAHTMKLIHSLPVPMCAGVDHADFSANGRYMLASCEFVGLNGAPGRLIQVDMASQRVTRTISLGPGAQPQDVKLSPDGTTFYISDLTYGGVWLVNALTLRVVGFIKTGAAAHGLYVSRDGKDLYVSDRDAGAVSVVSFAAHKVVATWHIPGGGSPDMGNVSADGKVLWLSGRYNNVVYAFNTATGHVTTIPVGRGPHGVCVWPQPGRYSLGHTGIMR